MTLAEAIWRPSGEKANAHTVPAGRVSGPIFSAGRARPASASQTLSVSSKLAETMKRPSGENAHADTMPV